jgi:hypothetical protein
VSRFQRVDATQVGGAIQKLRFVFVRVKEEWALHWHWPKFEKDASLVWSRMYNLLTPPGLESSHHDCGAPAADAAYVAGSHICPMPTRPQSSWIKMEGCVVCIQMRLLEGAWASKGMGLGHSASQTWPSHPDHQSFHMGAFVEAGGSRRGSHALFC